MAESTEHDEAQVQEEDVWSSISSNEEILERVPNDHKALHSRPVGANPNNPRVPHPHCQLHQNCPLTPLPTALNALHYFYLKDTNH